jgi:hypothetical protein
VLCTPVGAFVHLDGSDKPIGKTPLRGLPLPAGAHVLRVRAPGYEPTELRIDARGSTRSLSCALQHPSRDRAGSFQAMPSKPAPHDRGSEKSWYQNPWIWAGVGAVVVVAGGAAFALSQSRDSTPETRGGSHGFP